MHSEMFMIVFFCQILNFQLRAFVVLINRLFKSFARPFHVSCDLGIQFVILKNIFCGNTFLLYIVFKACRIESQHSERQKIDARVLALSELRLR